LSRCPAWSGRNPEADAGYTDLILAVLIILVILAVFGGFYVSPLVWILVAVLLVIGLLYYRRGRV
jgi:hypothetical protein